MSNTEFVMVPREPTAEMLAAAKKSGVIDPRVSGYCFELMVAAAPKHQGEPVAWMNFDGEGGHDFTQDQELAEHWRKSNGKYKSWLTPLYTHADPGEVTLQQIMHAYEYAESHPHKYLRGTTNWCAAIAWHLNKNRGAQSGE